jgi:hypothetical protein
MRKSFSAKEHTDSGLAFLLLLLLAGLIFKLTFTYKLAVVGILFLMIKPVVFFPFTFIWLNVSDFLGKIISKVLLSLIFLVFVLPVGMFRKLTGKDSLKIKMFRKSGRSVFIERNHKFTKEDLINPY